MPKVSGRNRKQFRNYFPRRRKNVSYFHTLLKRTYWQVLAWIFNPHLHKNNALWTSWNLKVNGMNGKAR